MLEYAQEKAAAAGTKVNFVEGDMSKFRIEVGCGELLSIPLRIACWDV
jgi:ubiquinone/menaquinone biosynthesis C-methylase UbiE